MYEQLTGQRVAPCMFRVKAGDDVHSWMGASPDGLVAGVGSADRQQAAWEGFEVEGARVLGGEGGGLLEIKCPFNRCVLVLRGA